LKQNKKRKYNKRKRDTSLTKLDSHAFINLNKNKITMTDEHKKLLGKHLINVGYRLAKDKSGKTIDDVVDDMKNVFVQIKKLKTLYDRD